MTSELKFVVGPGVFLYPVQRPLPCIPVAVVPRPCARPLACTLEVAPHSLAQKLEVAPCPSSCSYRFD